MEPYLLQVFCKIYEQKSSYLQSETHNGEELDPWCTKSQIVQNDGSIGWTF